MNHSYYLDTYHTMVSDCAREAFGRMCREPGAFYLYYVPSNGDAFGRLAVVPEDGCVASQLELVTGERIPSNTTIEGLRRWIGDRTTRIPLLPTVRDGGAQ